MNTSASLQCHCVDPLVASSKCAENSNSAEQQLACTEMGPATKGRKRYEGSLRMSKAHNYAWFAQLVPESASYCHRSVMLCS